MLYGDISGRLSGSTQPSPDAVIDAFDDQDHAEYSGPTTAFGFTDAVTRYGNGAALTATSPDASYYYIESTSGLTAYPSMADEFSVWVRTDDIANAGVTELTYYQANSGNDKYFVRVDWNGDLELFAFEGGTQTNGNTSGAHGATDNLWYQLVVRWDDGETFGGAQGEQTALLYDADGNELARTSIVNNTFSGVNTDYFKLNYSAATSGVTYYWDEAYILSQNTADTSVTIDSFEDAGLTEYAGATGDYTTTTTYAYDESRSLEVSANAGEMYSESGLNAYPSEGDTFDFRFRYADATGGGVYFQFGRETSGISYLVYMDPAEEDFELREDNGSVTIASDKGVGGFDYANGKQWWRVVVDWQSGDYLVADLYDAAGTQYAHVEGQAGTAPTNNGLGFKPVSNSHVWHFDDFRIL